MEPMILMVESAPVPVLLHSGFLVKAASNGFKNLLGVERINDLESGLKRFFLSGENLDQLIEGFTHKKELHLDLISYSKGSKTKWKAYSLPVAADEDSESVQITWFVDNSYGDTQTSYWNLHVRMNKFTSELIMNRKKLEDSMMNLQKTHDELRQTQIQLLQSEKLASIGQLAAGIAHEINNPIGFISSNLQSLEQYLANYAQLLRIVENLKMSIADKDMERAARVAEEMAGFEEEIDFNFMVKDIDNLFRESQSGMERIKKIIQDLRTFARADKDVLEMVKVEAIIDSILSIIHNELRYKAELKKDYGDVPLVKGNPQRLGQVFINLLLNAVQSIKEKGVIEIKTYTKGDHVCVDVSDTGSGIEEKDLSKIFDAFYTTKPVGQGTGLGLSISYEIVKKHGGEITIQSKAGKGSTFTVTLPITQS